MLVKFTFISLLAGRNASFAKSARVATPEIINVNTYIPAFYERYTAFLNVEKPKIVRPITPIAEVIRDEEIFSDTPEEYDIWSDSSINPYNVDLTKMKDTVVLNLAGFVSPVAFRRVNSDFGLRRRGKHYGIDLDLNKGDDVYSAFDGVVRITKRIRGYGNTILVKHFNGIETLYGHLSKILVQAGDTVKAGTIIGLGGSTGRSTGPHLHFETRYLGNVINPNDLIDFKDSRVNNSVYQLTANTFSYKKEFDRIKYWTIRRGDTLGRIAIRTGVSITKLCSMNGISRKSLLRVGRKIRYN